MKFNKPLASGLTCALLMSFGSAVVAENVEYKAPAQLPVSYTHLTLPTNREVSN